MRLASIKRQTKETDISIDLELDGHGEYNINTSMGFFDHMLTLLAVHSNFDINIMCKGDTHVDYHHSCEDIGIALGNAIKQALGNKLSIRRYASVTLPMDEALVMVAMDISGRTHLSYGLHSLSYKLGDFDTELVQEFFNGICRSLGLTLHIVQLAGQNTHHIIECTFKAFARAISQACSLDKNFEGKLPSSKGMIQ